MTYVFALLAITADGNPVVPPNAAASYGLSVEHGVLMRSGEAYRGIGVNYFDLFSRTLKDPSDKSYDDKLKQLSEAEIPFARFMCCGFWPINWSLYLQDKEAYFKLLDGVVGSAERHNVGLIPSLFWYVPAVPDIVGEPMDQLGNQESKTYQFIRSYTGQVVSRYKDSPAIWGWEFGNEFNLKVDLPNASRHRPPVWPRLKTAHKRTARDEFSSEHMLLAYKVFAETVRKHDQYRILITGNSVPRLSAFHNTNHNNWTADTPEEFGQILLRDNPAPFNVLSVHLYPRKADKYPAGANSLEGLISAIQKVSSVAKKPLFVGEFGVPVMPDIDAEKRKFEQLLASLIKQEVPLAALWVYDYSRMENQWNTTFNNRRIYMLEMIAKANKQTRKVQ
jgi:hypothetical protein